MRLWQFEIAWARVIASAFLRPGVLGGAAEGRDLGGRIAEQVAGAPWFAAIVVRLALWLVWFAPLFTVRAFRTFGGLDEERREACLDALMHSDLYEVREVLKIYKLNLTLALIGREEVLAHIGAYDLGPYKLVDPATRGGAWQPGAPEGSGDTGLATISPPPSRRSA
jgi:hypothetical protein